MDSASTARRRTWIISGAAAVAVASVVVVGFSLSGDRNTPVQPPIAGAPTLEAPPIATVSGTWRPVRMAGVTTLKAQRAQNPVLVFRPDGTWGGSDGCNGLQGTYTIGRRGAFAATIGPHHLIGCDNVPNTGVLRDAKRLAVDSTELRLFAADGPELARYVRAG